MHVRIHTSITQFVFLLLILYCRGGITVTVFGTNLDVAQSPQLIFNQGNVSYSLDSLKGTVSLYSPGALLKIEIRHFDGPVFPYTLRSPRQYTSFSLARNSRAGEVESLPWSTLCSLLISMLDRSNLQTFRRWKPYLYPFFYRSIPESRAPKFKQRKVRLGFIKS